MNSLRILLVLIFMSATSMSIAQENPATVPAPDASAEDQSSEQVPLMDKRFVSLFVASSLSVWNMKGTNYSSRARMGSGTLSLNGLKIGGALEYLKGQTLSTSSRIFLKAEGGERSGDAPEKPAHASAAFEQVLNLSFKKSYGIIQPYLGLGIGAGQFTAQGATGNMLYVEEIEGDTLQKYGVLGMNIFFPNHFTFYGGLQAGTVEVGHISGAPRYGTLKYFPPTWEGKFIELSLGVGYTFF